jgi:hypothetical protein
MRTTYWPEAATLANACLHYVFDLWARQWRRRQAHGDVIIGRAGAQAALRRGSGSGRGVRGSPWGAAWGRGVTHFIQCLPASAGHLTRA